MKGYNKLGTNWNREMRNEENRMYRELYEGFSDVVGTITDETVERVVSEVIDAAKLSWKEPVDDYDSLPGDASEGDTRMERERGRIYRFNGSEWIEIQEIDVTAINEVDSRLTSRLEQVEGHVDVELTRMEENLQNNVQKSDLYDKIYGSTSLYKKPDAFSLDLPFNVYVSRSGKVEHNYDVAVNKNEVTSRFYVDVKNGDNNNPGTEDEPFESLNRAFRYEPVDEIVIKEGVYGWSHGQGGTFNLWEGHSFNIIGEGEVILGAHRDQQSWNSVPERNNVYLTNATSVTEIIDIRDIENPVFYERVNSIDEVENTRASYYIDGSDIYVRPDYTGAPDEKLLLNLNNDALVMRDIGKVFCEGITFTNTFTVDNSNAGGELYAKNCEFAFGTSENAVSIWGDVYFEFQNCRARYGERDGFNYHHRNGQLPIGIEIDCIGEYNGRDGANQNNGSTMHDGGKIIRIGGEYHNNHGPNVIDVNNGTQSLNIGVHAHHSTATSSLSNVDFRIRDEGGGSDMWLVNCVSHDSEYSLSVEGSANDYVENSLIVSDIVRL